MVIDKKSLPSFLLCYASQKGNAQAIAEDIFDQCLVLNLNGELYSISEIKSIEELKFYSCTVFIGSTTGDGDPPDSAFKFMQDLKNRHLLEGHLSWLQYTVLGLGDTNYTNFCNFGKTLHKHLQNLEAKCFYENGWADDGTGLEVVVDPWIEGLLPVLTSFLKSARPHSVLQKVICESVNTKAVTSSFPDPVIFSHEIKMVDDVCDQFPTLNVLSCKERDDMKVKKLKFNIEEKLTLPIIPSPYLLVTICDNSDKKINWNISQNISLPSAATDVFSSHVIKCRKLSKFGSLKNTLEISLAIDSSENVSYEPGDSFGIIVHNSLMEVDLILNLLNVIDKADVQCELSVDPTTKKRGAVVPPFIVEGYTLRQIFTHCVDFRNIPKKPFLRALCEYTTDDSEKRRLLELVSKEGSEEYNEYVRFGGLTFQDLLILFQSCKPPISLVLEHLPRLLPRPYSITSSPLDQPNILSFAFNVIEISQEKSVTFTRKGICTGWLDEITKHIQENEGQSLEDKLKFMTLDRNIDSQVFIYLRCNKNFRLPKEISTPIIMVGPGTGVAPFIGFLKHREALIKNTSSEFGNTWLFFGCRHKAKDFIYQNNVESFLETGVLSKLFVCFSRDEEEQDSPKYVQDHIINHGDVIVDLIKNKMASIYVCGDAKNMSKNVFDAFQQILQNNLELDGTEARKFLAQMQLTNRYLQDVWA